MSRSRCLLVLALVLSSASARAEKSRTTAQALSGGGAAVSGAVVLAGFLSAPHDKPVNEPVIYTGVGLLMVTPSLGEFYAGQYLTLGMGIRVAATGLAIYTLQTQTELEVCVGTASSADPKCEVLASSALPLLGIAAIGFIGGVWWDALGAGPAVDRYNASHGVQLAPTVQTTAQGFTAGLAGTF